MVGRVEVKDLKDWMLRGMSLDEDRRVMDARRLVMSIEVVFWICT
jgi:hypothetical protein